MRKLVGLLVAACVVSGCVSGCGAGIDDVASTEASLTQAADAGVSGPACPRRKPTAYDLKDPAVGPARSVDCEPKGYAY